MDAWEKLWFGFIAGAVVCAGVGLIFFGFNMAQSKKFNGYYMIKGNYGYSIYIDWENRYDEKAYYTTNPQEAINTFQALMMITPTGSRNK